MKDGSSLVSESYATMGTFSHAFSLPIKNVHVYNDNANDCERRWGDVS